MVSIKPRFFFFSLPPFVDTSALLVLAASTQQSCSRKSIHRVRLIGCVLLGERQNSTVLPFACLSISPYHHSCLLLAKVFSSLAGLKFVSLRTKRIFLTSSFWRGETFPVDRSFHNSTSTSICPGLRLTWLGPAKERESERKRI